MRPNSSTENSASASAGPRAGASEADSAHRMPAPNTVASMWWVAVLAQLLTTLRSAAGLVVLAVVPLFLVFANTQIKEMVDRFIGGCVLVIQKSLIEHSQLLVTGSIAGVMPQSIPLVFEGKAAAINTILFDEAYRQDEVVEPDDLAFHPSTGAQCPGRLCETLGEAQFRPQAQIILKDLRPEFKYRFIVRLQPSDPALPVQVDNLKVYALFDAGLVDGVCRVQPRRWFNFWVWASPLEKAGLFTALVVCSGLLLGWAKPKG